MAKSSSLCSFDSKGSFEPDDLPKPKLDDSKGSFCPDDLLHPELNMSKGSFKPDQLAKEEQMPLEYEIEKIVPVEKSPAPELASECSQEDCDDDSSASSYEEVEVNYKITERITAEGKVITEKVEVIGDVPPEIETYGSPKAVVVEKDLNEYSDLQINIPITQHRNMENTSFKMYNA